MPVGGGAAVFMERTVPLGRAVYRGCPVRARCPASGVRRPAPGARRPCGRGVGVAARRCGVPLRPPVPPQRHDCPQLRQVRRLPAAAAGGAAACGCGG
ncbi:hypothetical protein B5181_09985 [Streptomyces sp. 4F]|nr:hypothetical protein B5181_09985 [Streptomyces sp. 4F]